MIPKFNTQLIKKRLDSARKERMNQASIVLRPIPFSNMVVEEDLSKPEEDQEDLTNIANFYDSLWRRLKDGQPIFVRTVVNQLKRKGWFATQVDNRRGRLANQGRKRRAAEELRDVLFYFLNKTTQRPSVSIKTKNFGSLPVRISLLLYSVKKRSTKRIRVEEDYFIALVAPYTDTGVKHRTPLGKPVLGDITRYFGVSPRFLRNLAETDLMYMEQKKEDGWSAVIWNHNDVMDRQFYQSTDDSDGGPFGSERDRDWPGPIFMRLYK